MSDTLTREQRHRNMAAIHSVSTKPEKRLRLALWREGFRYRINDRRLPGSPDIVLPKYRTAIFVHGCFWHGHKGCKNYTVPKTNTGFWVEKVARNQAHDQDVWRMLEARGWMVIIVWECELGKDMLKDTVGNVSSEIIENGRKYQSLMEERKSIKEQYDGMKRNRDKN